MVRNSVLLVVDVQKGFDDAYWGTRNNQNAEENIKKLLDTWRLKGLPVIIVQHMSTNPLSPLRPGYSGNELKDFVKPIPGELLIQKQANNAFIATNLEQKIKDNECDSLIICGLTTNHCISTTARMSGDFGFNTMVVSDATAAFEKVDTDGTVYSADTIHKLALLNIKDEFATILNTRKIIEDID